MEMTNEQVVKNLVEYLLTQNPKIVASMCANMVIDMNRFLNLKDMQQKETEIFLERVKSNISLFYEVARIKNNHSDIVLCPITECSSENCSSEYH